MVRPKAACSDSSARARLARSRSSRFSTTSRGSSFCSADSHTFSVWTSTPETASITTRAASETRMAAAASLKKLPKPGVSIRLILCRFHSAYAIAADRVRLRAISSSSKSVAVVPSSTRPRRFTMPASNRMAEASWVLPALEWPTMATFLRLEVS